MIIKTPKKPKNIAIHVFRLTFSLNINADNATIITGANDPILWAFAKVKYLNDKTNKPDSIIDNTLLKICSFTFPDK